MNEKVTRQREEDECPLNGEHRLRSPEIVSLLWMTSVG